MTNPAIIRAPVLAIFRALDDVIARALSVPAVNAALAANPDALVVANPDGTHELSSAAERGTPHDQEPGDHMMPGVVELIGDWSPGRPVGGSPG